MRFPCTNYQSSFGIRSLATLPAYLLVTGCEKLTRGLRGNDSNHPTKRNNNFQTQEIKTMILAILLIISMMILFMFTWVISVYVRDHHLPCGGRWRYEKPGAWASYYKCSKCGIQVRDGDY